MSIKTSPKSTLHHGQNIKRLREIVGKKQEYLADDLEMTQSTLSKLEKQEEIDDKMLARVAKALNIPVEILKNLTEEGIENVVSNIFTDFKDNAVANGNANSGDAGGDVNNQCTYNSLERMLAERDEKISELGKMVAELKAEFEKNRK